MGEIGVDGRIIIKCIFGNWAVRLTGFIWLRIWLLWIL